MIRSAQVRQAARQYSSLLTFAGLDLGDTFSNAELAGAVRALPPDGLREAADTLVRALEGAGDQREEYWRNRILPFWEKIWPKSNDRALDTNTSSLARLAIAAGNEFSSAISKIGKWLQPIKHPDYVIHRLLESGLCSRSPEAALELLRAVLDENSLWIPPELRQCLNQIIQQQPELSLDRRYLLVDELARRVGI